jgi:hypothetical protein
MKRWRVGGFRGSLSAPYTSVAPGEIESSTCHCHGIRAVELWPLPSFSPLLSLAGGLDTRLQLHSQVGQRLPSPLCYRPLEVRRSR